VRRTVPLGVAIVAPLLVAAVAVVVGLFVTGTIGPGAPSAEAGGQNRAVVIVDTGSSVRAACVLFSEDSISGAEALQRSGMNPIFQGYSGLGGAVCSLNGVGCPSDGSCLTCQAPSYWQYWRSSGGSFSYSGAGASGTSVTDGSIEGWRWGGTRSAPPFQSVDAVCGAEAPPPTTPPATQPSGTGGGGAPASGSGTGGAAVAPGDAPPATTPDGEPGPDESTTTTVAGETTTTTAAGEAGDDSSTDDGGDADEPDGEQASSLIRDEDGGAGQAGSVALATGAFAAIGFFVWRARRRNHLAAVGAEGFDAPEGAEQLERLDDGGPEDPTSPGGG
jgi:hypothetical protein